MSSQVIIGLAIGGWLMLIGMVVALARAAHRGDVVDDRRIEEALGFVPPGPGSEPLVAPPTPLVTPAAPEAREARLFRAQLVLLALAVAGAVLASNPGDWRPYELVALLAVLAVGSDLLALEADRVRISGSFLALVLAMALLGPAPAAAIGLLCAAVDGLRLRHARAELASNLATYALFPLLGGLALQWLSTPGALEDPDGAYALLVLAVFLVANALNFALIAGHTAYLQRSSFVALARRAYLPVLPWELAAALLTAAAVFGYQRYGPGAIGIFALGLGIFQVLLKALLEGVSSGRLLERRTQEIGVRHERLIGLMLRTISLRDPTAARHAAAVAHYAGELARASGMGARDQEVCHTAGLLHDLGREAFPDAILVAERELTPSDRRLVNRHPVDGARLVSEVPGLEAVAEAVLAHHERPDGRGYPYGLSAAEIPLTARVLAVAEVYDVLTAPDSYLRPRTGDEAVVELRRAAGTQLDARLVETFAEVVLAGGRAGFRRRGDADLDAELQALRVAPLLS